MKHIESFNELSPSQEYFSDIDRMINAQRLESDTELQQLVRSIDELIESLIMQILSGLLTETGAKLKVIRCLELIHHCQIGMHTTIKLQLNRLIKIFEKEFGVSFDAKILSQKPTSIILSATQVQHYFECIKDNQFDPMYSEYPKEQYEFPTVQSLQEVNNISSINEEPNPIEVSKYYLSQLVTEWNIQKKKPKKDVEIQNERELFIESVQNQLKKCNVSTTQ